MADDSKGHRRRFDGNKKGRNDTRDRRSGNGKPGRGHKDKSGSNRSQSRDSPRNAPEGNRKHPIPQDPAKLLYKGIDMQINGKSDIAMIMFLHGAVMMSEGCVRNAERILDETGRSGYLDLRGRIAAECTTDALLEFDYICLTKDPGFPRGYFDESYGDKGTHAIYRRICLGEVEGDDPIIDVFASRVDIEREKVVKGLDHLKRKKDSAIAARYLDELKESDRLRQSMNSLFVRARKGNADARDDLRRYSSTIPEAAFFLGYLEAMERGDAVEWLKSRMPEYEQIMVSKQAELRIGDDPFGKYLQARNLRMKGEEWVPAMMNAARAGSDEAATDLLPLTYRTDVARCLAGMYADADDLDRLMLVYRSGFDDLYQLERYCGEDPERVRAVGSELGKMGLAREIRWLKDHCDNGMVQCRDALIELSHDPLYQTKAMLYALHDIGADMEAAHLYFAMEGSPEIPSFKWLSKVCVDEDVKEFVRSHYEAKGDIGTFEAIFTDDGYVRKKDFKRGSGRGPGKRGGRRYRSPRSVPRNPDPGTNRMSPDPDRTIDRPRTVNNHYLSSNFYPWL